MLNTVFVNTPHLLCAFATFPFLVFQVRGLEFNAITPNLLASGADDGEICIWDLAKPSEPSHFPLLKVYLHYLEVKNLGLFSLYMLYLTVGNLELDDINRFFFFLL